MMVRNNLINLLTEVELPASAAPHSLPHTTKNLWSLGIKEPTQGTIHWPIHCTQPERIIVIYTIVKSIVQMGKSLFFFFLQHFKILTLENSRRNLRRVSFKHFDVNVTHSTGIGFHYFVLLHADTAQTIT